MTQFASATDNRSREEVLVDLDRIKRRVLKLAPPNANEVPLFNAVDVYSLIGVAERLLRGL